MIFQSQKMQLQSVRIVSANDVNEVHVCKNLNDKGGGLYTVVRVMDHSIVRRFLEICEQGATGTDCLVDCFSWGDDQIIVFPYVKERLLFSFYRPDVLTLPECEDICINLIIAGMSSGLPWPLLYQILEQEQIHLTRDGSVYLGFMVDLSKLDPTKTEKDCVVACAKLSIRILQPKDGRESNSLALLSKKVSKESYSRFVELYKDVRISAAPKTKKGIPAKIKQWYFIHKDELFRVLLWISIILAIFVIVSFLTQLIFGDVPWLRLFINSFEKIGTENLRK